MNVHLSSAFPLPAVLEATPSHAPRRRRSIGPYRLDGRDLDSFNRLLARLGRPDPLDCDQLVSAARELAATTSANAAPPCILQRLRWADSVVQMLRDPNWSPSGTALASAELVLEYVRGPEDLIPDWLPRVGRLDDAIVIQAAWPGLSGEVADYVDFRRLRRVEARLRGCADTGFRFTRADWERARQAEAALRTHQRRVRAGSYLPAASAIRHNF